MRYLVTARVKPGREAALLAAIDGGRLGAARSPRANICGTWRKPASATTLGPLVEVCYCDVPLAEERRIGKNSSSWCACKTRTPGALARIRTASEPWLGDSMQRTLETAAQGAARTISEVLRSRGRERIIACLPACRL